MEPNKANETSKPALQPKRRRLFIVILGSSILLLLGIGEFLSRIHYHGRFPTKMVWHRVRRYTLRPHWVGYEGRPRRKVLAHHNGLGLREQRELSKNFKGTRIVLLGDSVVYGYRLEDHQTLSVILERSLQETYPKQGPWQVINVGCYGYAVQDEADWLDELSSKLKADLVLLSVCYNDFPKTSTEARPELPALTNFLQENSALFLNLSRRTHQLNRQFRRWAYSLPKDVEARTWAFIPKGQEEKYAQAMYTNLLKVEQAATKMEAALAVTLWPARDEFVEYLKSGRIPDVQRRFFDKIKAHSDSIELHRPYLDIKNSGSAENLYLDHCHPSKNGIELYSPRLVQFITKSLAKTPKTRH